MLVLDEPTNDLDIESLELLEAALQDYDGTLLLVSHDRAFLDNVVTQTIAAEGGGRWKEYVGGYSDWVRQRPARRQGREDGSERLATAAAAGQAAASSSPTRKRASWSRCRSEIEALEAEQQALAAKMAAPGLLQAGAATSCAPTSGATAEIETLLTEKLERWEALESKAKAASLL